MRVGVGAASSCSMQELLVEAQIPPELRHEFLHFTPAEFALVAVDLEDLNKFIDELVFPPDMSQTLLVARVRLLWRNCQKLDLPCSSKTKPELPVIPAAEDTSQGTSQTESKATHSHSQTQAASRATSQAASSSSPCAAELAGLG